MTKRPRILGGIMIAVGYAFAAVTRAKRPIARELVSFRRREQMARLKHRLFGYQLHGTTPL
jgi:hypothetical protein